MMEAAMGLELDRGGSELVLIISQRKHTGILESLDFENDDDLQTLSGPCRDYHHRSICAYPKI